MALQQPSQRQPGACYRPMLINCFQGIVGTGRVKSALPANKGAQCQLVQPDQTAEQAYGDSSGSFCRWWTNRCYRARACEFVKALGRRCTGTKWAARHLQGRCLLLIASTIALNSSSSEFRNSPRPAGPRSCTTMSTAGILPRPARKTSRATRFKALRSWAWRRARLPIMRPRRAPGIVFAMAKIRNGPRLLR